MDPEDELVDFNNASLYLPAAQTVFSICTCAIISVLSCWLAPNGAVSAVRTLALCTAVGGVLMRAPVRFGKAHGVTVVFASLQLAIPLYIGTLVVEQLVHTCTNDVTHAPSWRHVVFHSAILAMVVSGFMRARAPLDDTDLPFIITAIALMLIAIMPPPAVALVGPLCQSVTLWEAADRVVRAFCFGLLYCVTVYASTKSRTSTTGTSGLSMTLFFRSASASIWVSGALVWWLPLAAAQCAIILHARFVHDSSPLKEYKKIESTASTDDEDLEANMPDLSPKLTDPLAEQARLLNDLPLYAEGMKRKNTTPAPMLTPILVPTTTSTPILPTPTQEISMEPMGQLTFQQVSVNEAESDSGTISFSASIARAMAKESDSN